jgi:GT2 family glycosyltransferase
MILAIGIVTYNRREYLEKVVNAVRRYTASPYYLVAADDGSTDGSREFLSDANVTCLGNINRGIAWNKNRVLYTMMTEVASDCMIMLEDDTLPNKIGWEGEWIKTVSKYGYCTYAHPKVADSILGGDGTSDDPFACTKITSQCSSVTREAVDTVGYFDSRFKGYGVEDGEWSTRLRNSGYGIIRVPEGDGYIKANCMISGGVETLDVDSYRDNDSVKRNRKLFEDIRNDPIPRTPWASPVEETILKDELKAALYKTPLVKTK